MVSEWMVSVDTEPLSEPVDSDTLDRLLDELLLIAHGPALSTGDDGAIGTTFTIFGEPDEEQAATRGRNVFAAALRLAGVAAQVGSATVSTYDPLET